MKDESLLIDLITFEYKDFVNDEQKFKSFLYDILKQAYKFFESIFEVKLYYYIDKFQEHFIKPLYKPYYYQLFEKWYSTEIINLNLFRYIFDNLKDTKFKRIFNNFLGYENHSISVDMSNKLDKNIYVNVYRYFIGKRQKTNYGFTILFNQDVLNKQFLENIFWELHYFLQVVLYQKNVYEKFKKNYDLFETIYSNQFIFNVNIVELFKKIPGYENFDLENKEHKSLYNQYQKFAKANRMFEDEKKKLEKKFSEIEDFETIPYKYFFYENKN